MSMTKNSTTENGIITTTYTRLNSCGVKEISYVTKQMEGSPYYVFVDADNEPTAMEHDERGEIGGLWFEGTTLTDCGCLPEDIRKLLIALGFTVDEDF